MSMVVVIKRAVPAAGDSARWWRMAFNTTEEVERARSHMDIPRWTRRADQPE